MDGHFLVRSKKEKNSFFFFEFNFLEKFLHMTHMAKEKNSRMALGIEDCVKLTRQASTDNERMAILLLIGMDFQTLDERIHGHKVWFRTLDQTGP